MRVDLRTVAYSTRFFGLERTSARGKGVEYNADKSGQGEGVQK
jgi:hypothetical protein